MRIPVVVNGDIVDPASARAALEASGADAVMIGRGAYGAPWMPARIAASLAERHAIPGSPPLAEQGAIAAAHVEAMLEQDGPAHGLRNARKHIGWYLATSGRPPEAVKDWRRRLCTSENARDVLAGLATFYAASRGDGRMNAEPARERAGSEPAPAHRARSAARRRCRIPSSCWATTTACSTPTPPRNRSSRSARACSSGRRCPTSSPSPARSSALVGQVRRTGATVNEYGVDVGLPRSGVQKLVDVFAGAMPDHAGLIVLMLQQRSMAQMIERQLTHRAAARSVSGMAAVLAHEIKNPLSGIRGAAQLLEPGLKDDDRALTQLICTETDRIRNLVDRMEVFGDERPLGDGAGQHPLRCSIT